MEGDVLIDLTGNSGSRDGADGRSNVVASRRKAACHLSYGCLRFGLVSARHRYRVETEGVPKNEAFTFGQTRKECRDIAAIERMQRLHDLHEFEVFLVPGMVG